MKGYALLDIATFLIRAWSGKNVLVKIKDTEPSVRFRENMVIIPTLNYYYGNDFGKYRQWRVNCWSYAMRLKYSSKFLSNDLAYGYILNTLEKKRVERLGIVEWPGIRAELVFNEAMSWQYEPVVNSLYGLQRIVVAFSQYFSTGYMKGDVDGFQFARIDAAARIANDVVDEAIIKGYGTEWVERFVPKILKVLEIDPLFTIPFPYTRSKMGVNAGNEELISIIERIFKVRKIKEQDELLKDVLEGKKIREEFEILHRLSLATEKHQKVSMAKFPVEIPEASNEVLLYDVDLVNRLERTLKNWKTGWIEKHSATGDEFDVEGFIHGRDKSFIKDVHLRIKSKLAILLDHSSSVSTGETSYKRAFVALCKVLDYLTVKFVALAFNTSKGSVKCWMIKSPEEKWSKMCERRVQNVKPSGGTPLAEVYENTASLIKSFKPTIFLTLSDGEPNDPPATREAISDLKRMGVQMVSFGIGEDTYRALEITRNLKKLGYDRCVAISRLHEVPRKVLHLLASALND